MRRVPDRQKEGRLMGSKTETYYPPYAGKEPYIHLCFSARDERKVQPLLRQLLLRGCRVWYSVKQTGDRAAQVARNERMLGAGLTVLYLTGAAREDTELKTRLLVCQKEKQPILVLNTDGGDSGLSLGLTEEAAVTDSGSGTADVVSALLHGQGFSQVFMGLPQPVYDRLWLRRASAVLIVLSLLLASGIWVYRYLNPPPAPVFEEPAAEEPSDTDRIGDSSLLEAARAAIGGGPVTDEALAGIDTLRLSRLPESADDLSVFPNLKVLVLTEDAAKAAPGLPLLYERYTLIVTGGEEG